MFHLTNGLRALAVALPAVVCAFAAHAADQREWRHALSLFGEVKYPPGFGRFDYVNPNAPKGGVVRQMAFGAFDNFNLAVSGVKGSAAVSLDLIYDTLMVSSMDEVSTEYGLIAESAAHPDDFSWVAYRLRPEAKWHDGRPITVDDVIYSFEVWKKY